MNYTHAIITYSKVHHLITGSQAKAISLLPPDGEAMLNGQLLKRNNVADILTIDEYYRNFPQKRLQVQGYKDLTLPAGKGIDGIIRSSSVKALEEMKKGLENYLNSSEQNPIAPNGKDKRWHKGTEEPVELLLKIQNKINAKNYENQT